MILSTRRANTYILWRGGRDDQNKPCISLAFFWKLQVCDLTFWCEAHPVEVPDVWKSRLWIVGILVLAMTVSPPERRLSIMSRSSNGLCGQQLHKASIGDLGIHATIRCRPLFVKVSSGCNGMVRRISRATINLMGPFVPFHLMTHVFNCVYFSFCCSKDVGTRIVRFAKEVAMDLLSLSLA